MTSIRFILNGHPYAFERGDTAVTRLIMEIASDYATVCGSALWTDPPATSPFPIECIPRPPVQLARLAARSLPARRSIIHTRYNVAALAQQLESATEDRFVAIHSYMAEPALRLAVHPPLYVNYVVSEAAVLRKQSGHTGLRALRQVEARRTWHDEVRCCQAAVRTGCFDDNERTALTAAGIVDSRLLRICLPPAGRVAPGQSQNLLYLGDRTWSPNLDGLRRLSRLWPAVARAVPGARLLVVGKGPKPRESHQPGITHLGFVESLDSVWSDVRALVAPLDVGGGVRVKILEAASRGVPVIATPAAVGSLDQYLAVRSVQSDEDLLEACCAVLDEQARGAAMGAELYESNSSWWSAGHFRQDVATWLDLVGMEA
jgi:hypothetical protein